MADWVAKYRLRRAAPAEGVRPVVPEAPPEQTAEHGIGSNGNRGSAPSSEELGLLPRWGNSPTTQEENAGLLEAVRGAAPLAPGRRPPVHRRKREDPFRHLSDSVKRRRAAGQKRTRRMEDASFQIWQDADTRLEAEEAAKVAILAEK